MEDNLKNIIQQKILGNLTATLKKMISALQELDEDARIDAINEIKTAIHGVSPLKDEPVDCVLWIRAEEVHANDYNPNKVAPPEMKLLKHSISEDGYTQPIVAYLDDEGRYEVIDGFHRNVVGRKTKAINTRIRNRLPLSIINGRREGKADRIASTIRHNRARGRHVVDSMADIVLDLSRRNWSDTKIAKELGMGPDEVLRLKQVTGLAEAFADRAFSAAWEVSG